MPGCFDIVEASGRDTQVLTARELSLFSGTQHLEPSASMLSDPKPNTEVFAFGETDTAHRS